MKVSKIKIWGEPYRAVKHDGEYYVEPPFLGDVLGKVVKVEPLENEDGWHILLHSHDCQFGRIWLKVSRNELELFGMENPRVGEELYFQVYRDFIRRPKNRHYKLVEGSSAKEFHERD